jgi:hypothetical protein
MKCNKCGKRWPNHLVNILYSSGRKEEWLDPICALKEIRKIHKDPTYEFSGEMSKELYIEALKIQRRREKGGQSK